MDVVPTIPAFLRRAAADWGDEKFVITTERDLTFADVERESRALALRLVADGVVKGSRVGFLLPQTPEWIIAFLAITRIGAVAMPLSTFSTPTEVRRCLRLGDVSHLLVPTSLNDGDMQVFVEETVPGIDLASSPRLYLHELPFLRRVLVWGRTDRRWASVIDPAVVTDVMVADGLDASLVDAMETEVVPADHLLTLFTSGTTSGPKGVIHTHGAQLRHVANICAFRGMKHGDRFFAVSPFFWVAGLTFQVLPALYFGGGIVCQERFDPEAALDLVERTRPNIYLGFPTALLRMREHPSYAGRDLDDIAWLKPVDGLAADPSRRHSGMGMTETCGNHTIAPESEIDRILPDEMRGAFGAKVPYVQHKVIDPETQEELPPGVEGELCIRGYSLMAGYVKREREEVFDIDGWFHTSDRGYFRDGYLFFTGRANDMIKTAGSNVAPREVEDVLLELPEVKLPMVLGLPDEQRGEIVVIGIVPQDGATIDAASVRAHLRTKLSSYKVPREDAHVQPLLLADVPFINGAKPDRKAVRRLLAERLGRSLS